MIEYEGQFKERFPKVQELPQTPILPKVDNINKPPHYTYSSIEPIDAIEAWGLSYHLGCAIKYIARAGHKGDAKEDIAKAIWYLQRWLEKETKEEK